MFVEKNALENIELLAFIEFIFQVGGCRHQVWEIHNKPKIQYKRCTLLLISHLHFSSGQLENQNSKMIWETDWKNYQKETPNQLE